MGRWVGGVEAGLGPVEQQLTRWQLRRQQKRHVVFPTLPPGSLALLICHILYIALALALALAIAVVLLAVVR